MRNISFSLICIQTSLPPLSLACLPNLYMYVCAYMCIYIHICRYTYVCMCAYVCRCICIYEYV